MGRPRGALYVAVCEYNGCIGRSLSYRCMSKYRVRYKHISAIKRQVFGA
jgi:hypothetical protein